MKLYGGCHSPPPLKVLKNRFPHPDLLTLACTQDSSSLSTPDSRPRVLVPQETKLHQPPGQSGPSGLEPDAARAAGSRSLASLGKTDAEKGVWPLPYSPPGAPVQIFPIPPLGPGLTSRSSTDTSSFNTASMAAAPPQSPHTSDASVPQSPSPTGRVRATSGVRRKRALLYADPTASRSRRRARPLPAGQRPASSSLRITPVEILMRTLLPALPHPYPRT